MASGAQGSRQWVDQMLDNLDGGDDVVSAPALRLRHCHQALLGEHRGRVPLVETVRFDATPARGPDQSSQPGPPIQQSPRLYNWLATSDDGGDRPDDAVPLNFADGPRLLVPLIVDQGVGALAGVVVRTVENVQISPRIENQTQLARVAHPKLEGHSREGRAQWGNQTRPISAQGTDPRASAPRIARSHLGRCYPKGESDRRALRFVLTILARGRQVRFGPSLNQSAPAGSRHGSRRTPLSCIGRRVAAAAPGGESQMVTFIHVEHAPATLGWNKDAAVRASETTRVSGAAQPPAQRPRPARHPSTSPASTTSTGRRWTRSAATPRPIT